nr:hypothetical protein [Leifsonia sp. Leaf325]
MAVEAAGEEAGRDAIGRAEVAHLEGGAGVAEEPVDDGGIRSPQMAGGELDRSIGIGSPVVADRPEMRPLPLSVPPMVKSTSSTCAT